MNTTIGNNHFFVHNKENFLHPDESNFQVLIDKISMIHQMLYSKDISNHARIPFDPGFSYHEEIKNSTLPKKGSSLEEIENLIKGMFEGVVRWHSTNALLNIAPSPLLDTVAIATLINLYNPNTLWDFTSGKLIAYEKKVIKFLAELADWNPEFCDGLATFGGKATLMYAIKIGISKLCRQTISEGIKQDYLVISSDRAHYSLENICSYLGIGKKNCIRIKTCSAGSMVPEEFEKTLTLYLNQGKNISCIILNAGVTIDFCIDSMSIIIDITKNLCKKFGVVYPHFHADSVAGWPWLFFKHGMERRQIGSGIQKRINSVYDAIRELKGVDSFSADFHKTGLCPYTSTFFVAKEKSDISLLTQEKEYTTIPDSFYEMHPHHYTLENSRSGTGIGTAWLVLQRLGIEGFQDYLLHMLTISDYFRSAIIDSFSESFYIVNPETRGFEVVIKIHFFDDTLTWDELLLSDKKQIEIYQHHCHLFKNYLYTEAIKKHPSCPLIGFIPKYKRASFEKELPSFLIYPMSVHVTPEAVDKALTMLTLVKQEYEVSVKNRDCSLLIQQVCSLPPR